MNGTLKLRRYFCWLALPFLVLLGWDAERGWARLQRGRLCSQEYEPPPPGMVFVPAGEFLMGSDEASAEPGETPLRKVFLPAFYIDQFEVTNRRYQEFKQDHRYPPGEETLPVTHVLKREAEEFCRWAGRRLPANAEWEKAARGVDGRIFPWGREFSADRANIHRRAGLAATDGANCQLPSASSSRGKLAGGSFPKGASPYGCQDMAGNVWEWVSDVWVDQSWLGQTRQPLRTTSPTPRLRWSLPGLRFTKPGPRSVAKKLRAFWPRGPRKRSTPHCCKTSRQAPFVLSN